MKKLLSMIVLSSLILLMSSCTNSNTKQASTAEDATTAPTTAAPTTTEDVTTTTKETIEGREVLEQEIVNSFGEDAMNLYGRYYYEDGKLVLDHNGTGFEIWFFGTTFQATISTTGTNMYTKIYLDDETEGTTFKIVRNRKYTFYKDLEEGVHKIKLVKSISTYGGKLIFSELLTDGKFLSKDDTSSRMNIEFIGDSITCGAGVLATNASQNDFSNSDVTKAYSYMTAEELNMNPSIVSCCGICTKGKTTLNTSMLEMYPWYSLNNAGKYDFKVKMDYCVIALGTNDAWYMSITDGYGVNEYSADYQSLIEMVREKNPDAYIICTYGYMNTNSDVITAINKAIENVNDPKVSYLQVPTDTSGGSEHPGLEGAVKQKDALVAYIKSLMNE